MKMEPAHNLLNHAVAAGIRYMVSNKKMEEDALTTSMFIEFVAQWNNIATTRCDSFAMSFHRKETYKSTIIFFNKSYLYFSENKNWFKRSMEANSNWDLFNNYVYFRHPRFIFKFIQI